MLPLSFTAIFCEDIRFETAGTQTLVGLMPDNAAFPTLPAMFPKLAVYIRASIDPEDTENGPIEIVWEIPGQGEKHITTFTSELIAQAKDEAKNLGAPIAGVLSRLVTTTFVVAKPGRILVRAKWSNNDRIIGNLNVQAKAENEVSTASEREPPS